ncbi:MAG: alpha-galactosidase [Lachnospiraceae bacterium]|nr:alpha-galactosidase [Lachnospiraceae bacterium]
MAIYYQHEERIFTLNTDNTTYQIKVDKYGFVLHLYYGKKISGNMDYLLTYYDRGFSGNPADAGDDRTYSMDALPQEYPVMGMGDYRNSAVIIRNADCSECCDLRYVSHEIKEGKYSLKGLPAVYAAEDEAQTLEILLEDPVSKVQVKLLYGVLEKEDIITRSAVITNDGEDRIIVEKAASACLDFISGDYDFISFYGRHAMERNFQRTEIAHGSHTIGSRRGASSHQYNPAVIISGKDTTEDNGSCYGLAFVYSGNFMCEAEKDQYGQTRVIMGLQSDLFHYPLSKDESLIVPETILCYSSQGFGTLSKKYHTCIRKHICRGKYSNKPRPILINSWEAAYFNFNGETIYKLAKDAVELGLDMVVMDDGWFGNREDDNSSLGDWQVNEKKLGCTLGGLIQKINALGIKFGIWIEPEMVSEKSSFYKDHPDWVMKIPKRQPVRGRNQLVLDFSREEVRTHVFKQICDILDQGNVEYIKWDMNRSLADIYSMDKEQGRVTYDYVLGVYDFLEKLTGRYPDILIEGCCGGGGRFDAGMLYYAPQIWCSDNTDALDRIKIQYGTSFFYPVSAVGAHVSASPNHQTGRSISIHTKGVVAMAGTFGYELNPDVLTKEEKEEIKEQIACFKKNEALISTGDYYRLSNPYKDEYAAWMFVSEDANEALLSVVMLKMHGNMTVNYVKLRGLKADAIYKNEETGQCYYGSALMEAGLPMPAELVEYPAYQFRFVRC